MAKMSVVPISIVLVFLCSALYAEGFAYSQCSCGPCAPGCKPQRYNLGGPDSRYCICQCNCDPSYNPPSVPSNPPPIPIPIPRPTPVPTPPKSSPRPPPSFSYPRKPQPPPTFDFGGFDVFGCVNIMEAFGRCMAEIGNLFIGNPHLDPDCCGTFTNFSKSCGIGDVDMLPPEVVQYCGNH